MKYYSIISGEVNQENDLSSEFQEGKKFGSVILGKSNLFVKKMFKADYIPVSSIKRVFQRVKAVDAGCCPPVTIEEQYFVFVYGDEKEYEVKLGENRHGDVAAKKLLEVFRGIEGIEINKVPNGKRSQN